MELIPVNDRYGSCEGCARSVGTSHFTLPRKPMYLYDGRRLCKDCTRKAIREVQSSQ